MTTYLIAAGGTGARCLEALVHLSAAGLGPDHVKVLFVDPDTANGNVKRATDAVRQYISCRANTTDHSHGVFAPNLIPSTPLLVSPLSGSAQRQDLEGFLELRELEPSLRELARVFYSSEELTTSLRQGFRGHPSVGAPVMASLANGLAPLCDSIREELQRRDEAPLNVFIVGSIFGGTGAAAIPVLGRLLRNLAREEAGGRRLRLGAAPVLPYFSFPQPPSGELAARPGHFLVGSQAALHHYWEMGRFKEVFDALYFVGENSLQEVKQFALGENEQRNPPHYVEILVALAAIDFFRGGGGNGLETEQFWIRRTGPEWDWTSLPQVVAPARPPHDGVLKAAVTSFALFAGSFLSFYAPLLEQLKEARGRLDHLAPWLFDEFKPGEMHSEEVSRKLADTRQFLIQHLEWLEAWHQNVPQGMKIRLLEARSLCQLKLGATGEHETALSTLLTTGATQRAYFHDLIWEQMCRRPRSEILALADPFTRFHSLLYDAVWSVYVAANRQPGG